MIINYVTHSLVDSESFKTDAIKFNFTIQINHKLPRNHVIKKVPTGLGTPLPNQITHDANCSDIM